MQSCASLQGALRIWHANVQVVHEGRNIAERHWIYVVNRTKPPRDYAASLCDQSLSYLSFHRLGLGWIHLSRYWLETWTSRGGHLRCQPQTGFCNSCDVRCQKAEVSPRFVDMAANSILWLYAKSEVVRIGWDCSRRRRAEPACSIPLSLDSSSQWLLKL